MNMTLDNMLLWSSCILQVYEGKHLDKKRIHYRTHNSKLTNYTESIVDTIPFYFARMWPTELDLLYLHEQHDGYPISNKICLPFDSNWDHPRYLVGYMISMLYFRLCKFMLKCIKDNTATRAQIIVRWLSQHLTLTKITKLKEYFFNIKQKE